MPSTWLWWWRRWIEPLLAMNYKKFTFVNRCVLSRERLFCYVSKNVLPIILLENILRLSYYTTDWFLRVECSLDIATPWLFSWCQSLAKKSCGRLRPVILQYGTGTGTVARPQVWMPAFCQLVSVPSNLHYALHLHPCKHICHFFCVRFSGVGLKLLVFY